MSATQPMYTSGRIQTVVYNEYIRKQTDMTLRKNPFLAALTEKGRITNNWSQKGAGPEFEWPILYKSVTTRAGADRRPILIGADNPWKRAKLPWRKYDNGQSISKFETLINGPGQNSLVRIVEKMYPIQVKSITDRIAKDIMSNDGNATTGECNESIHGFPSWLTGTGTTVYDNSGKGLCDDPHDSYAGINTDLNYYGGSWTSATDEEWPMGIGSYEYQFWSPMLIDAGSSHLEGTTHDWAHQWKYAMLVANTFLSAQHGEKWDAFFLTPNARRQAVAAVESGASVLVRRGPDESTLVKLGFAPISYEGVDIEIDPNITTANHYGYGCIFDYMELRNLQAQLIMKDEDTDITAQADIVTADAFVNLRVESPAYTCAFVDGITEAE
jgi:hypothetical protein